MPGNQMTLHEAMRMVLLECPNQTASFQDLSAEIARRGLYIRGDGQAAPPAEVSARAGVYTNLFERVPPGQVRLKPAGSVSPALRSGSRGTANQHATAAALAHDEHYVVDLCDEILGQTAQRQHRFAFLQGDTGVRLPVDAYYPALHLVVEYRERQHTESVPFFDKRVTASGISRDEQRRLYDQRRREVLPQHGIAVLEIDYHMLAHDSRRRLRRDRAADLPVVRRLLAQWIR
jgi:hypothetical protein